MADRANEQKNRSFLAKQEVKKADKDASANKQVTPAKAGSFLAREGVKIEAQTVNIEKIEVNKSSFIERAKQQPEKFRDMNEAVKALTGIPLYR